ncbi:MAG: hypothetical protein M3357_17335 [Actinomycetota bacterium]|nr:hypothetical protein [Actinomycetota bacterium]
MTMTVMHLNRSGVVAFFAFLFFFFGCGDPDGKLPDHAVNALTPQVEAIRAAAAARDRTGAQAGVDQLRAQVSELRGNGVLSEEDATRVLDAVGAVEARLALLPAPTTTTTTAPPPPPQDDGGGHDEDKGKGKGKDDKGDGDD